MSWDVFCQGCYACLNEKCSRYRYKIAKVLIARYDFDASNFILLNIWSGNFVIFPSFLRGGVDEASVSAPERRCHVLMEKLPAELPVSFGIADLDAKGKRFQPENRPSKCLRPWCCFRPRLRLDAEGAQDDCNGEGRMVMRDCLCRSSWLRAIRVECGLWAGY